MKDCAIKGCDNHCYAKGFCHNHYEVFRRTGNAMGVYRKKCEYPGCTSNTKPENKFCSRCKLKLRPRGTPQGARNSRWNNGSSPYKSHSLMKKNRITKMQQTEGICEICKNDGHVIHHIDESKNNHNLENLIFICHKCHKKLHPSKVSKYYHMYGKTMCELAEDLNCSTTKIHNLHKSDRLKDLLTQPL